MDAEHIRSGWLKFHFCGKGTEAKASALARPAQANHTSNPVKVPYTGKPFRARNPEVNIARSGEPAQQVNLG
jgi:hypothetical protein